MNKFPLIILINNNNSYYEKLYIFRNNSCTCMLHPNRHLRTSIKRILIIEK